VFVVDSGKELFVWVGKGASEDEQKNGLPYAHSYLMKTKHPLIPVSVVKEGKENAAFNNLMK
jgi:gelsolin